MGRVRAFEREGRCHQCGWIGGLDADLCILCQNLKAVTDEPATVLPLVPLDGRHCTYCGAEHEQRSEFCKRCLKEIAL